MNWSHVCLLASNGEGTAQNVLVVLRHTTWTVNVRDGYVYVARIRGISKEVTLWIRAVSQVSIWSAQRVRTEVFLHKDASPPAVYDRVSCRLQTRRSTHERCILNLVVCAQIFFYYCYLIDLRARFPFVCLTRIVRSLDCFACPEHTAAAVLKCRLPLPSVSRM